MLSIQKHSDKVILAKFKGGCLSKDGGWGHTGGCNIYISILSFL